MNGAEIKATLKAGGRVFGTMLSIGRNPRWIPVLSGVGLDYVIIDTEHNPRRVHDSRKADDRSQPRPHRDSEKRGCEEDPHRERGPGESKLPAKPDNRFNEIRVTQDRRKRPGPEPANDRHCGRTIGH